MSAEKEFKATDNLIDRVIDRLESEAPRGALAKPPPRLKDMPPEARQRVRLQTALVIRATLAVIAEDMK